jgi:hypothetical protein
MAVQYSVAVRNARLDAIETTIGTAPTLEIRTGLPPADCAAADAGTVLCSMTLPSDWMAAAVNGSKSMSGTWQDGSADASGRAAHFRIKAGSTCHIQGIVSEAWVASKAYVANDHVTNDGGKLYRCTSGGTSASSGGPTGTGSSITDGTVTWQYLEPAAQMTIQNIVVNAGQQVTVTSFVLTAGNA